MRWTRTDEDGGDLDLSWFVQLPACLGTAAPLGPLCITV